MRTSTQLLCVSKGPETSLHFVHANLQSGENDFGRSDFPFSPLYFLHSDGHDLYVFWVGSKLSPGSYTALRIL